MYLPTYRRLWRSIRDTDAPRRRELAHPAMGTLLLMGAGTGTSSSIPANAITLDNGTTAITLDNGTTFVILG